MRKDKNQTKNDIEWGKIFKEYKILEEIEKNGIFEITADEIKRYREPRLMTKFDHKVNLPDIFSENKLSILPITRGSYVISDFKNYHNLEMGNEKVEYVEIPAHIQSIDASNIFSETVAINCAYFTNILRDFLEEDQLYPTIEGRMGSGAFNFQIEGLKNENFKTVKIKNSQIEIDGAYEGIESIALIEAKRDLSKDFLIRQLYYPFRLCKENKNITKRVRSIFLVYSNGLFTLYEYEFLEWNNYNSLKLVKKKNYSIEEKNIEMMDIKNILYKKVEIVKESVDVSFPQANDFLRIINMCELLVEKSLSRDEITIEYAFDIRQTNYYTDAGIYLGLIEKKKDERGILYSLTSCGEKIMKLSYKKRQLAFCSLILSHKVFNDALKSFLKKSDINIKEIVEIMKKANLNRIGTERTYARRASTIKAWLEWIIKLTKK